jgi:6-pyruvoyltetrahydropterin/6-carboxytetrahydropterin synthase
LAAPLEKARLMRTVHFHALHHYGRADRSAEENRRVFGEQSDPHGHDWRVEVHVAGPLDPDTGWCADVGALDAHVGALLAGWHGGDLNALIPEVAAGRMTPSTENLAKWIHDRLAARLQPPVRLIEVRVFESDDLGSAWPAIVDPGRT